MGEHRHDHVNGVNDSGHVNEKNGSGGKKKITAKIKNAPDMIHIDRQIHDGAIVISASLILDCGAVDLLTCIAGELETAAHEVKERGGIVGHIKASVSTKSTSMISVADETAMIKESPLNHTRITLAAIVFLLDPEDAQDIIRKALTGIRTSCK